MKLGYVIVYVEDVLRTVVFYEKAFGLKRQFIHETEYGEMSTGATKLAFVHESMRLQNGLETLDNRQTATPPGIEIALVCEDVYKTYDKAIQAGAAPVKAPAPKPWGQIVGYARDINGLLVELCTAMPE